MAILLLMSCATTKSERPDWVDGNSSQYTQQRYVLGRGQSDNQALARDRARADLAKVFNLVITEQSEDIVSQKSIVQNKQTSTEYESEAQRHITTRTNQLVKGIQTLEQWQDPETKTYYVLVGMDRLQTGMNLRNDVNQLDSATDNAIHFAQQQSDLLVKINHANQALLAQQQRNVLQQYLQILDTTGIGVPAIHNIKVLTTNRDALLQRIYIHLEIENDPIGGIELIINGSLAKAGFKNTNQEQANFILSAELQISDFTDEQGWFWYRGHLQIDLKNKADTKSRGIHRWEVKVSSRNQETAKQRVRESISQKLSTELRDVISNFGSAS